MESTDNFAYLLPFIFICFGLVFLVLPRWHAGTSLRYWGAGFISAAFAFCMPMIFGDGVPRLTAMLAEFFFLTAHLAYGQAVLSRFGMARAHLAARLGLWLAAMAALSYVVLVRQDLRSEMIISDFCCALQLGLALVLARARVVAPVDRLLALMASLVVLDAGSRSLITLVLTGSGSYPTLDSFFASDYAYFTQVTASVIGFLLALSILGAAVFDIVSQHRQMAEHDPLTELLNRRGFERLAPDFRPDAFPAGVIIVSDIDRFKRINDQFGHAAGDRVIIAFAAVLRESLPGNALITRFGGEEFVAYLPGLDPVEADRLANLARSRLEQREWLGTGIDQTVTASFGVSSIARGDHSIHDAIGRADACLYAAKSGGRNQVVVEGGRGVTASAPTLRIIPKA